MKTRFNLAISISFIVLMAASCGGGSSGDSTTSDDSSNVNDTDGDPSSGLNDDPAGNDGQSTDNNTSLDIANLEQFRSAIQKTWSGACIAEGQNSYRLILNVTADRWTSDFHDYEGLGCTGIPTGYYFPISVDSYSLANLTTAANGNAAWEIDWTVVQPPSVGGEQAGEPAGTPLYDIISYDNGLVLTNADGATAPENRPNELEDSALVERTSTTIADLTAQTVQGVWVSNCHRVSDGNRRIITTTLNIDTATDDQAFYASDDCSGEPYATRQDSWTSSFGETYLSTFGDTMIAYDKERVDSVLLSYDADAAGDLAEPGLAVVGVNSKRFDAYAIEMDANGPVLMTTYCVIDDSNVCEKSAEGRSDMIDYNWSVRWTRS